MSLTRKTILSTLALAAMVAPLAFAGPANAQASNACAGRVFINAVYPNGSGQNGFEYFLQVQNRSNAKVRVTLSFSGFPAGTTLFSPQLPGIPLAPYEQQSIRFGRGSSPNLNLGNVAVAMDGGSGSGPTIRVVNCLPG